MSAHVVGAFAQRAQKSHRAFSEISGIGEWIGQGAEWSDEGVITVVLARTSLLIDVRELIPMPSV